MSWWPFQKPTSKTSIDSLDEFIGDQDGRDASPLELSRDAKTWQTRLSEIASVNRPASAVSLSAFTLIRGGDLFERTGSRPTATDPELLQKYQQQRLIKGSSKIGTKSYEHAVQGILRVLSGNPAVCLRMLLAKPIVLTVVPPKRDFREFGFPRHTNPHAAGIFYNKESSPQALLGLREEYIFDKPWLMIHEMMHAIHLMGFTKREREMIDGFLMPVYRSRRWVEEAVAIYAECAFGAKYGEDDFRAPGMYGKLRREWTSQAVFSLFMSELLRP